MLTRSQSNRHWDTKPEALDHRIRARASDVYWSCHARSASVFFFCSRPHPPVKSCDQYPCMLFWRHQPVRACAWYLSILQPAIPSMSLKHICLVCSQRYLAGTGCGPVHEPVLQPATLPPPGKAFAPSNSVPVPCRWTVMTCGCW